MRRSVAAVTALKRFHVLLVSDASPQEQIAVEMVAQSGLFGPV